MRYECLTPLSESIQLYSGGGKSGENQKGNCCALNEPIQYSYVYGFVDRTNLLICKIVT